MSVDIGTIIARKPCKEYMEELLRRTPVAAPGAIGIDEVSLRKGHRYRIVVSDPVRGDDLSEESLDRFY